MIVLLQDRAQSRPRYDILIPYPNFVSYNSGDQSGLGLLDPEA